MCSIIGYNGEFDEEAVTRLLNESRVRGLHAFGYATPNRLMRTLDFNELVADITTAQPTTWIAHFRYSTSGDWRVLSNNQPIASDGVFLAFNGVISQGSQQDMESEFGCRIAAENDAYVLAAKLHDEDFLTRTDISYAAVWLDGGKVYARRNRKRPMWKHHNERFKCVASTQDILYRAGLIGAPAPVNTTLCL